MSPRKLAENAGSKVCYKKGTCPVADSLFERSILLAIPSCLTASDEDDSIHAFEKVMDAWHQRMRNFLAEGRQTLAAPSTVILEAAYLPSSLDHHPYSCLSATMGSTLVARRAGI